MQYLADSVFEIAKESSMQPARAEGGGKEGVFVDFVLNQDPVFYVEFSNKCALPYHLELAGVFYGQIQVQGPDGAVVPVDDLQTINVDIFHKGTPVRPIKSAAMLP